MNPTPEAHAQEPILTAAELLVFGPPSFNDAGTRLAISTIRQLAAALESTLRHCEGLPQIDNGQCAVCRTGFRKYLYPHRKKMVPGKCENDDCASHLITANRDLLRRYNDGK